MQRLAKKWIFKNHFPNFRQFIINHRMMKFNKVRLTVILLFIVIGGHAQVERNSFTSNAIKELQKWYKPETGLWETTSWWNAANALTAIVRYSKVSKDSSYLWIIENTFDKTNEFTVAATDEQAERLVKNYINDFYDDEGWWALAWIEAYDLTGEKKYLLMAQTIFDDMKNGWDEKCNGGIYWKKERPYKAAISNELFMLLAGRLALRTNNQDYYLGWAKREWDWFSQTGMIGELGLVHDGVRDNCEAKGRFFTYNQGVILAALTELGQLTGDKKFATQAENIALAAIENMSTEDGVLKGYQQEENTPDGVQFKGIFMRHLAYLNRFYPNPRFVSFIETNANAIQSRATKENSFLIGSQWEGPFDKADAGRQSSAIGALVSSLEVSN